MSWFSDLTSKMEDLTAKVGESLPMIDTEKFQKLTLTSPELVAERRRIDEEERRKEANKNKLSGLYPWETRDKEREILVQECKEAILALSSNDETFFGPYQMPALPNTGDDDEEEDNTEEDDDDEEEEEKKKKELRKPSPESLEKLEKLSPLPSLLADFDLDSHVGLIQRLLEVDKVLVEKQSKLSGGGERERTFWHNYFFHCAFTRYEAGLSIDEIWSPDHEPTKTEADAAAVAAEEESAASETITFEANETESATGSVASSATSDKQSTVETAGKKPAASTGGLFEEPSAVRTDSPGSTEGGEYDMLDDSEMDELEAEIARELQD